MTRLGVLRVERLEAALHEVVLERRRHLLEANALALRRGAELAAEQLALARTPSTVVSVRAGASATINVAGCAASPKAATFLGSRDGAGPIFVVTTQLAR